MTDAGIEAAGLGEVGAEEARRPGRPRSAELDQAILAATVALFVELGYDGFSVEGVAARAGVSKATIYRRYPGKVELLLEAAAEIGRTAKGPIPDTGTLRGDLRALARGYRRLLEDSDAGRAIPAMIVARDRDPELHRAHRGFVAERRADAAGVVRRGVERGEIPPDAEVELIADLVAGPLFYRILISGDELDDAYVDRLVDAVLAAFSG